MTQNQKRGKAIMKKKHKNYSEQREFEISDMNFHRFNPDRDQWESLTYIISLMRVCMELDLLRAQVIKSQLCLWIWYFPSLLSSVMVKVVDKSI